MKKILLLLLLLSPLFAAAQQFSQYNTETLFDSFENPSQRSFIRDSSYNMASNFLIPNFGAYAVLTGNAQRSIQSRLFDNRYSNSQLDIGSGRLNRVLSNAGIYWAMFKWYAGQKGDKEMGLSFKTNVEASGDITDESIALFNGSANFPRDTYNNLFNSNGYYQTYHQLGFSYREKLDKRTAFGFKVNFLMGLQYQELLVNRSNITFNRAADQAILFLDGLYYVSESGGEGGSGAIVPSLSNPGASVSIGGSHITEDGFKIQANVKDLGFIHWSGGSESYRVLGTTTLSDLSQPWREDSVKTQLSRFLQAGHRSRGSFTTPTNGLAELSVAKRYYLNYDQTFSMLPTLIVQKQLFYQGLTGALVDHFQYNKFTVTATASYNDLRLFNFGGQVMYKSPNAEFYIGSERLLPSGRIALRRTGYDAPYTGADVFLGFSLKFGRPIESPMNASYIPMGDNEKGFFGRFFDKIFGKRKGGGEL
ncbi:hypothetical protein IM792_01090 [Mucilaginibacter sp. JRF]|uniref:DUF5723 family protein n=1 Tax=Mucilaginibacter sp. JRF TaxID=2780088 RepID=UPI001881FCAC|nr:DUF5723 family protein [Mucilaginibacter sp. JRF]MBE9583033.1 hypothetical protein [Mucilaginibacter sp. JRF]